MFKVLNATTVGISLPKKVIAAIDEQRKDVPRSRFLLRIIEQTLASDEKGIVGLETIQEQRPTAAGIIIDEEITHNG